MQHSLPSGFQHITVGSLGCPESGSVCVAIALTSMPGLAFELSGRLGSYPLPPCTHRFPCTCQRLPHVLTRQITDIPRRLIEQPFMAGLTRPLRRAEL